VTIKIKMLKLLTLKIDKLIKESSKLKNKKYNKMKKMMRMMNFGVQIDYIIILLLLDKAILYNMKSSKSLKS
jgi:hypothetical protein